MIKPSRELELLIKFRGFILYTMYIDKSLHTYETYLDFMDWVRDLIQENNLEDYNPRVDKNNWISVWFETARYFNLSELKKINPDKKYKIHRRYDETFQLKEICNSNNSMS